jgi:hypothetical protein
LRISLLCSISVSGNFPSFRKIMLKQSSNTHNPIIMNVSNSNFIILIFCFL